MCGTAQTSGFVEPILSTCKEPPAARSDSRLARGLKGGQLVLTSHAGGSGTKAVTIALSLVPSACIAIAVTFGAVGTTVAQQGDAGAEPGFYERVAFDAADTDGDGLVSLAELARDAAAGFSGLDTDRSETLTPGELGAHDPAMFSRIDADGDGVLTFPEVMTNKTRAFEAGDENEDGGLSFEEMVDAVETEQGART
jgi:Ca2+-binding EF-hand superfamily protein